MLKFLSSGLNKTLNFAHLSQRDTESDVLQPNHFPRVGMGPSHILKEERRERMILEQVCDGADQGKGRCCIFLPISADFC